MTREERQQQIAKELYQAREQERKIKSRVDELKDEFFKLAEDEYAHKDHMLPVRTIEIPDNFFIRTGMTHQEFVETRYPGWNIEHVENTSGMVVFILKRDPSLMPVTVSVDGVSVTKTPIEYTPEIDWDTLMRERYDLYKQIAKVTMKIEVDETRFEKLIEENPMEMNTIARHMKVKKPSLKVTAKKVKDDE